MLQIWQGEAEHIASILKRQHQLASGEMALNAETKRCKSEAKRDRKRVRERQRQREREEEQIDRAQGQDDSKQTTTMSKTTQKPDEEFKFFFV